MKARDLFGLITRILGLLLLILAVWYLVYALAFLLGLPQEFSGESTTYVTSGTCFLIISLLMLKGADALTDFTYPPEDKG